MNIKVVLHGIYKVQRLGQKIYSVVTSSWKSNNQNILNHIYLRNLTKFTLKVGKSYLLLTKDLMIPKCSSKKYGIRSVQFEKYLIYYNQGENLDTDLLWNITKINILNQWFDHISYQLSGHDQQAISEKQFLGINKINAMIRI